MRFLKSKKGQAAIEYMVTYGWAFLVILASVSVLAYFGFLNPSKYIPDRCDFGEQLKCVDHYIEASDIGEDGTVVLRFKNNFELDINITNAYPIDEDITLIGDGSTDYVIIGKGAVGRVEFETNDFIYPGEKERFSFIVTYKRAGGAIEHNLTGQVFAEVVDNALSLV